MCFDKIRRKFCQTGCSLPLVLGKPKESAITQESLGDCDVIYLERYRQLPHCMTGTSSLSCSTVSFKPRAHFTLWATPIEGGTDDDMRVRQRGQKRERKKKGGIESMMCRGEGRTY